MKKLLLLLFLSLSITTYAQPPSVMPPYNVCDTNNDGFTAFDLTTQIPAILNGLNPATTQVSFHETLVDAQANAAGITNIGSYINLNPFVQTLYIRVDDNANSEVYFSSIDLRVNPAPMANPGTLTFCDPNELPIYGLTNADAQITGGAPGFTVSYYQIIADAEYDVNVLGPSYIPLVNPGAQTLFARVTNQVTGCYSITTLTLNTQNCNFCPAPINLAATNVTDTSFTLNWASNGSLTVGLLEILVVPYGTPLTPNTAGYFNPPATSIPLGYLEPGECYSVYLKAYCSGGGSTVEWSSPLNICMPNCANSGECPDALILNAFLDSNNNGVKDTGEANFDHGNFVYQANDSGTNQYGNTNSSYYNIFDSNPANSYDISFAINSELSAYYTSAVSFNNITIPVGSGSNHLNFPIVNVLPHIDAQVSLTPYGQPRPGFTYTNVIYYQNNGSQTIANGTLTFTKDPQVGISYISQSGVTTTSTGFTYDFTNLAPNEIRYINLSLLVPTIPTISLGDLLTNSVAVQITGDINSTNNTSTLSQVIVGSFDPNDMTESHGGKIVHADFTSNDYLYYTIQFENTGTASADFIRVEDALGNQLDESTFEMISSSHNVNTKRNGNQLTWHFYDINLPPTVTNPNESHGYINFRIKPKTGYAIGDIIPNTASIYFDLNPPITTNTFDTEFVQALGNTTFDANTISLYPNPANDRIKITNNGAEKISKLSIYDLTGKRIYTLNNNSLDVITIDVSHFAKGLYLVELASDNNLKITKKLILK